MEGGQMEMAESVRHVRDPHSRSQLEVCMPAATDVIY